MPSQYDDRLLRGLAPVSLDAISALTYECFIWTAPGRHLGGLISFHGTYHYGFGGTEDALFIKWRTSEFCDLKEPGRIEGLIVDFRDMDYRWGDDLYVPASRLRRGKRPIRIVVDPGQVDAYASILETDELRTDLDVAATEVNEILRGLRL